MAGVTASAVVPTLGRSRWLVPCLEALRREGLEIVVVDQGETPVELPDGLADRVLRPGRNLGFAGGTNLGIAEASAELVATVNDDALVEPGWLAALARVLEGDSRAAAAQGVTLMMGPHPLAPSPTSPPTLPGRGGKGQEDGRERPSPGEVERGGGRGDGGEGPLADGCGLEWNRWWQAVQIGHGKPAPPVTDPPREIFGVSATVALYRRVALREVAPDGNVFDPRLISYYEDVELAGRLRAAGWRSLLVPAARAFHAGSATGATMSRERWRLIYGNRWLAAARLPGSGWARAPKMLLRDLVDLAKAAGAGDGALAGGIMTGWARAARELSGFLR